MCSQDGAGFSQGKKLAELDDLIAALDEIIAALDTAGEKIAAAHADMARNVLLSKQA